MFYFCIWLSKYNMVWKTCGAGLVEAILIGVNMNKRIRKEMTFYNLKKCQDEACPMIIYLTAINISKKFTCFHYFFKIKMILLLISFFIPLLYWSQTVSRIPGYQDLIGLFLQPYLIITGLLCLGHPVLHELCQGS